MKIKKLKKFFKGENFTFYVLNEKTRQKFALPVYSNTEYFILQYEFLKPDGKISNTCKETAQSREPLLLNCLAPAIN